VGQRLLAFVTLAVVLVLALMFSLLLLPFVVAGACYLWWKMRKVHKQLSEMQRMQESAQRDGMADGEVIEGEVIREHRAERFIER